MRKLLTILSFLALSVVGKSQTPNARCANPVKINLSDSANYFNLSGYLYPLSLLVDGNTSTMPVPTSGEKFSDYYDPVKGWRWDFDLLQSYYITNVKIYWGTSNADTAKVWISDSVFNGGAVAFARLRNVNSTTWDIASYSTGSVGWVDYVVNDSARHFRIQMKNAQYLGNPFPSDGIREIEVYGCRIGSPAPIYQVQRAAVTLPEMDGTNIAAEIHPVSLFKRKKMIRSYMERDYMDNENVAYPNNRYRYALFGGNPYPYNDSIKNRSNIFFWPTVLGSSQYIQSTGGKPMEYMSLDNANDDPEDQASYEQAADFAWHVGHLWGDDEDAYLDTSYSKVYDYASITGGPKPYANNTISGYENDNERSGWWKWFGIHCSPIARVAKASMEKDGDQGRYPDRLGGNRMGVKMADDSLDFIMAGLVGISIEDVKAECYLSLMLRGEVMWDWVQVHEYFSLYDGPVTFTSNGQIGNRGTFPEDDSARIKYAEVPYWVYRIAQDTTVKTMTGEHGKDVSRTYPQNAAQVDANYTQYGSTFYVHGGVLLDSFYAQALDIGIDRIEGWAAKGFQAMIKYLFHDLELKTNPGYLAAYVSSGEIEHGGAKKPSWYYNQSLNNLLEGYVCDTVLSYTGYVHYRGRKIGNADSVVDYIRLKDDTTGAGISVNIDIGSATAYTLRQPSFTGEMYTTSSGSPSGGEISTTATIYQQFFFTYQPEGSMSNISPVANAGSDQTITVPSGEVLLFGADSEDPDGTISTYVWTKVEGPESYNILLPNQANTLVTGLNGGRYKFRLTITDNNGATHYDEVTVIVNVRGRRRYIVL